MPSGATSGLFSRVVRMMSFCAWVTSWSGSHWSPRVSLVHRKIEISILSYQRPFIRSTCWLAKSPAPNSESDTHMVMITARVIVRFCRNPARVSERIWRKRIQVLASEIVERTGVLVAVDAAGLITNDRSVVKFDHALAHLIDDGGVVCGHQHGGVRTIDAVEKLHDSHAGRWVKVSGWLVGDENHGPVHERPGDRDALLFSAGQLFGKPSALSLESNQLKHLRHDPLDGRRGLADDLQGEGDVLRNRLVGQQAEVLEDRADLAAHGGDLPGSELAHFPPRHKHLPLGGPLLTQDQPQKRGFSRSRRADEEDELALLDLDVDLGKCRPALPVVGLGHVVKTNHSSALAG